MKKQKKLSWKIKEGWAFFSTVSSYPSALKGTSPASGEEFPPACPNTWGAFRGELHALQNFVSPNSAAAWQNAEISMRFPRFCASLAEFSTSTAEISKRLVNFCFPKARFLDIVSAENPFGRGVSFCSG
ncbi:MAG: hypothetical protein IKU63_06180 [Bacteroidaceae bacterium]|nr:hypothetical protein [Bacteroidaceae bacterium]